MTKKKILIIGKNGLISSQIFEYLKRKKSLIVKQISFNQLNQKNLKLDKINYIINCASNKNFVNKSYNSNADFDYLIAQKIREFDTRLIIISTRKIYKPGKNLKENSKKLLNSNYSRNKFLSEINIKNTLKKNYLILRLPNLLCLRIKKCSRKLHKTYLDLFIEKIDKGIMIDNGKIYKDFLPIEIFCKIVLKLINIDASGIYNVSIGKKVFLNKLNSWLNFYNKNQSKLLKVPFEKNKSLNQDAFYLNNSKLLKKINIKLGLTDIKKSSIKISKKIFNEK